MSSEDINIPAIRLIRNRFGKRFDPTDAEQMDAAIAIYFDCDVSLMTPEQRKKAALDLVRDMDECAKFPTRPRQQAGLCDAQHFFTRALRWKNDECLLWPYALANGIPTINVRVGGNKLSIRSVRKLVCESARGPAPKGHFARVTCGHDQCVAPLHIIWMHRSQYGQASTEKRKEAFRKAWAADPTRWQKTDEQKAKSKEAARRRPVPDRNWSTGRFRKRAEA